MSKTSKINRRAAKEAAKEVAKEAKKAMKAAKEAKEIEKSNEPTSYILYCTNNWQKFEFPPNTLVSTVLVQMFARTKKKGEPTAYSLVRTEKPNLALPLSSKLSNLGIYSGIQLMCMYIFICFPIFLTISEEIIKDKWEICKESCNESCRGG